MLSRGSLGVLLCNKCYHCHYQCYFKGALWVTNINNHSFTSGVFTVYDGSHSLSVKKKKMKKCSKVA